MILAQFKRLDIGTTLVMTKNTWCRENSKKQTLIGKKRKIVVKQTNGIYLKGETEDTKSFLGYPQAKGFSYKNGVIRIVHDDSHPELYIDYVIA